MIKRFPTRLSDKEEIDRLKVCVAQTLAVMDKLLEFWTLGVCPFTAANPDKPESKGQPTTTVTEPTVKPQDDNNVGHNNSSNHPYL